MKAKIISIISLLVVFTLALSGVGVAQEPQPHHGENEIEPRSLLPAPDSSSQQMPSLQSRNVALIGQIGGVIRAIAVQGDYAYVGVGPRLVILDISNPAQPIFIGQTPVLPVTVYDIAVAGNYAYAVGVMPTSDYIYLSIIDVNVPSSPYEVGHYNTRQRSTEDPTVEVAGSYAYVADWAVGLCIIDVRLPSKPSKAGSYRPPDWLITDVAVVGDYAFVTGHDDDTSGMWILDLSLPASPTEVGFSDRYGGNIAVAGNYAYVNGGGGLQIVDISIPSTPVEVGSYYTQGSPYDVDAEGSYAYVAVGYFGLRILDVSTPSAPVEVGFYDPAGYIYSVAVAGEYAYFPDEYSGMHFLDVSIPSAPVEVLFYNPAGGFTNDVAVVGIYAYVANQASGFHIIDISVPSAPVVVGYQPGDAEFVVVSGDHAYLGGWEGLNIIDVSVPSAPVKVGFYDTYGQVDCVDVAGNYAYVGWSYGDPWGHYEINRLEIIDVSNPSSPVQVGEWWPDNPFAMISGVAVVGNYAYVAADGFRILDVNLPSVPIEIGYVGTPDAVNDVTVSGNYAYVVVANYEENGWVGGLLVIDVSLPSTPIVVGSSSSLPYGWFSDVAVTGNYAYVVVSNYEEYGWAYSLRIIDVSSPTSPYEIGYYDCPSVGEVTGDGNYIYLANSGYGVLILTYIYIPPLLMYLPLVMQDP